MLCSSCFKSKNRLRNDAIGFSQFEGTVNLSCKVGFRRRHHRHESPRLFREYTQTMGCGSVSKPAVKDTAVPNGSAGTGAQVHAFAWINNRFFVVTCRRLLCIQSAGHGFCASVWPARLQAPLPYPMLLSQAPPAPASPSKAKALNSVLGKETEVSPPLVRKTKEMS